MAIRLDYNHTDTPVSGVTSLSLPISILNYGKDFRVKVDEPTEGVITNMTSPLGQVETIRTGISYIQDVYKNTGIDQRLRYPTRRGISIVGQVNDVWSLLDDTDTTYRVDLPVSCHIVFKIPECPQISASDIKYLIGRCISTLMETGEVSVERIKALTRGSLLPKEL